MILYKSEVWFRHTPALSCYQPLFGTLSNLRYVLLLFFFLFLPELGAVILVERPSELASMSLEIIGAAEWSPTVFACSLLESWLSASLGQAALWFIITFFQDRFSCLRSEAELGPFDGAFVYNTIAIVWGERKRFIESSVSHELLLLTLDLCLCLF